MHVLEKSEFKIWGVLLRENVSYWSTIILYSVYSKYVAGPAQASATINMFCVAILEHTPADKGEPLCSCFC